MSLKRSAVAKPIRGGASVDTARPPVSSGRPVEHGDDAAHEGSADDADRCTAADDSRPDGTPAADLVPVDLFLLEVQWWLEHRVGTA